MEKTPKKVVSVNLETSVQDVLMKEYFDYQMRINTRVSLSAYVNKVLREHYGIAPLGEAGTSSKEMTEVPAKKEE